MPASAVQILRDSFDEVVERLTQHTVVHGQRGTLGHHHDVCVTKLAVLVTKRLAGQSFETITIHRATCLFLGYRKAQACSASCTSGREHREIAVGPPNRVLEHARETGAVGQSGRARQCG